MLSRFLCFAEGARNAQSVRPATTVPPGGASRWATNDSAAGPHGRRAKYTFGLLAGFRTPSRTSARHCSALTSAARTVDCSHRRGRTRVVGKITPLASRQWSIRSIAGVISSRPVMSFSVGQPRVQRAGHAIACRFELEGRRDAPPDVRLRAEAALWDSLTGACACAPAMNRRVILNGPSGSVEARSPHDDALARSFEYAVRCSVQRVAVRGTCYNVISGRMLHQRTVPSLAG